MIEVYKFGKYNKFRLKSKKLYDWIAKFASKRIDLFEIWHIICVSEIQDIIL